MASNSWVLVSDPTGQAIDWMKGHLPEDIVEVKYNVSKKYRFFFTYAVLLKLILFALIIYDFLQNEQYLLLVYNQAVYQYGINKI